MKPSEAPAPVTARCGLLARAPHLDHDVQARPEQWPPNVLGARAHRNVQARQAPRRAVTAAASAYRATSTGPYAHRVIPGGVGQNLPQEAPRAFAEAVIWVDGF
jgi:hypothetical protein